MERLRQGLAVPLTLISAPAGFGKTTLISAWCASPPGCEVPLAWLSLEQEENDPTRFLTYLVAALGTLMPAIAETASDLLRSPQPLPLQAFLTGLINDLDEFPDHFLLALDDYHVIHARPVHAAVAFLLEHLPQRMHLVLLTRSDPPLPLARLRARGQLVEIRLDDLRFTPSEAAAFFDQVMGVKLSAADTAALEQRTEGWIAGLQLAALAIQSQPHGQESGDPAGFIQAFTGSHHYVADYLSEEVLNRQPERIRSFLLQTSILDRMTAELCDRVVGGSDSLSLLRQLDQANLFLVPLDEQRRWVRYHHLFAELLRSQLREQAPDQLPELHRRAAGWYEQQGFASEAIKHALAAGDQEHVARIIEQNAMASLMQGDAVSVLNWIQAVASLIPERPWLGIYQSWGLLITGEIEPIETRLQAAESWIGSHPSQAEAQEMEFHLAGLRALVAGRRGESQQSIVLARQALERLPESESLIRSIITFALGDASWSTGDLAGARDAFAEAARIDSTRGNPFASLLALSSVGVLLTEQGELHHSAETFRTVLEMTTQPNQRKHPVAAVACLGLSVLAYEWNDLEAAGRYAQQALALGSRWGNPDTLAKAYLIRARWQHARGETASALESLRQAQHLARGPGVTSWSGLQIDAFRVQLWLAQGRLAAARGWVRQQALHPEDAISYPRQIAYLTLARVLIAQQKPQAALALLERLSAQFEALGQTGRLLETLLLQALAWEAQGDTTRALEALSQALTLGEPEGYLRVFLEAGEPMADLLRHAGSRGIAPKYVSRLLSAFGEEAGAAPGSQQPLIEPLTERELQVLRLIAEGLSNQEIADRLVVAVGTIKTHTASLYRKLDVSSRTQAVRRAGELGLF